MFRRILLAALIAGAAAGFVASGIQLFRLTPLIGAAERFEDQGAVAHDHGHEHAHEPEWKPAEGRERIAYMILFDVLAGVGFGLLLNAGLTLQRTTGQAPNVVHGVAWGLAGFACFALAPAMGLPPELPGMPAADLLSRQTWWISTAIATAAGIALCVWAYGTPRWRGAKVALGIVAIALPHLIGAPEAPSEISAVPASLAVQFAVGSLVTGALFWLVLGTLSGWLQRRLD